jgi:putative sterol carrier protein
VPTVDEVFTEMETRVKGNPDKTAGMTATYQFNLTGDNPSGHWVKLADGGAEFGTGETEGADCVITIAESDFLDLVEGKLDGTMAFMSGKLKVGGSNGMALAMKLQNLIR